jgi:hypothetical protein
MGTIDNPQGLHLYAIARAGENLWLAGEQGYLARARIGANGAVKFERVQAPYQGSWFALLARADGGIVLAGLKGNVYRSRGGGAAFERIGGFIPVSVSAAAPLGERVLFVNQAGQVQLLDRPDGAARLLPQATRSTSAAPLAAMLALPGGRALGAGVRGVIPIQIEGAAP